MRPISPSRRFLVLALGGAVGLPRLSIAAGLPAPVLATATTEVFGAGLRLIGVALEYDGAAPALRPGDVSVEGRRVTDLVAAAAPDPATSTPSVG